MLIVHRLAPGGHRYYLAAVGPSLDKGEVPGQWKGRAAAVLGLAGDVGAADLRRVLPSGPGRVPGFDLTFAAPKSVSVLHGLGAPAVAQAVVRAHDAAVDASLEYLETHACAVRADGRPVPAAGFVGGAFRHRVSRADDPHLHTHVVVANHAPAPDGRWLALHSPLLYGDRRGAGAVYHLVLRDELSRRLGLTWETPERGRCDAREVPAEIRRTFSRRHAALVAGAGGDPSRFRLAERVTRPERDGLIDVAALAEEWARRAEQRAWQPPALCPAADRARPALDREVLPVDDRWTRGDVLVAMADRWVDGAPARTVAAACDDLLADATVIRLGRGQSPRHAAERYSTTGAVARQALVAERQRALPEVDSAAVALDAMRRDLAQRGCPLVVLVADASAAERVHARTGADTRTIGEPMGSMRPGSVAVIVGADRAESRDVARTLDEADRAGLTLLMGRPRSEPSTLVLEEMAVATVPTRNGDLTVTGSASTAVATALTDWVEARRRGARAVLVVPADEVDVINAAAARGLAAAGLRGGPEVEGLASGDSVRFVAAHPTLRVDRHMCGVVASVDQSTRRIEVEMRSGQRVGIAARTPSLLPAHAVPPLPSVVAAFDEAFVVGGAVRTPARGVVHRYVTVDLLPGPRQPAWTRTATTAELLDASTARAPMEREIDNVQHHVQLRRAALGIAAELGGPIEVSRVRVRQRDRSLAI